MLSTMQASTAVRQHDWRKGVDKPFFGRPSHLALVKSRANHDNTDSGACGSPNHNSSPNSRLWYGDECCYGKISLLHFIVSFVMGGVFALIVGAVQFMEDAYFAPFKMHFLAAGLALILIGLALLVVKCVCFRAPISRDEENEENEENEEKDEDKGDAVEARRSVSKEERRELLRRSSQLTATANPAKYAASERSGSAHRKFSTIAVTNENPV